jgi:hypothetical protein
MNNPIFSKLKQSEETDHKIEGMEPMFVEKNTTAKSRNYQTGGKSSPTWGTQCQESENKKALVTNKNLNKMDPISCSIFQEQQVQQHVRKKVNKHSEERKKRQL